MKRTLSGMLLLLLACGSANAALLSRAGGQAYYDDVLNITWLADANYAWTSGYDSGGNMTWSEAQAWIVTLNNGNHLGVADWRLPTTVDTGTVGCDWAYSGTDCGYNVQTMSGSTVYSEMAHLYYVTLGNSGYYNTSGSPTGCQASPLGPPCKANDGPFSNVHYFNYWSGTEFGSLQAWYFNFDVGAQDFNLKDDTYYLNLAFAWAVRDGDIGETVITPIPAAAWLFGGALGVLGVMRRRIKR